MSTPPAQDPSPEPPDSPNSLTVEYDPAEYDTAEYNIAESNTAEQDTAEYNTAVAALAAHSRLCDPLRNAYEDTFMKHGKILTQQAKLLNKIDAHSSTYQRHKQHMISLFNALLQSSNTLETLTITSDVNTHVQVLTQATLRYRFWCAQETLGELIKKSKKLEQANEKECAREQKFLNKSRRSFKAADDSIDKLDRLHALVIETGEKIGKVTQCGREKGRCFSCRRTQEKEYQRVKAERAEAEKVEAERLEAEMAEAERVEAKRAMVKKGGKIRGGIRKATTLGKQKLDVIFEEDESQEGGNA